MLSNREYGKFFISIFTGVFIMSSCYCSTATNSNSPAMPEKQEILSRLKKYPLKPYFPPAADRRSWNGLPETLRTGLICQAQKQLKKPWPLLTAAEYMRFGRAGDRRAWENPYFAKRVKLIALVTGECCEYKGRFIDEIIEGVWQILSEPVWCLPAHEGLTENDPFPDPSRFKIDLFNASTGKLLTDILQVLEPELEKVSPMLVERVKMEIMRRVVEPAEKLNEDNTWWFSGYNNWTPWCAWSVSGCAIYLLEGEHERLAKFLKTYLEISRRFYEQYPADGGCCEGPSYWRHAVGKYLQHLDMIDHRLQLDGRLFNDEKLRKMCVYPAGMNLCGSTFLSVSDSVKNINLSAGFLNFAAQKMGLPQLSSLASRMKQESLGRASELGNYLTDVFGFASLKAEKENFSAVNFWQDMGLAVLREKPDSPAKGTILSLKGGHNRESHNHNDLGHFTLMRGGRFLVADIGVGIYTAQTFNSGRYDIWNIGAQGHNQPRFGQIMQQYGADYKSVLTMTGDDTAEVDLGQAYPAEAKIKSLKRKVYLNRKTGAVEVTDSASLSGCEKVAITLLTAVEPRNFSADKLEWKQGTLLLENLKIVQVSEELRLDAQLKKTWGRLWRIELAGEICNSGSWEMKFDFNRTTGK